MDLSDARLQSVAIGLVCAALLFQIPARLCRLALAASSVLTLTLFASLWAAWAYRTTLVGWWTKHIYALDVSLRRLDVSCQWEWAYGEIPVRRLDLLGHDAKLYTPPDMTSDAEAAQADVVHIMLQKVRPRSFELTVVMEGVNITFVTYDLRFRETNVKRIMAAMKSRQESDDGSSSTAPASGSMSEAGESPTSEPTSPCREVAESTSPERTSPCCDADAAEPASPGRDTGSSDRSIPQLRSPTKASALVSGASGGDRSTTSLPSGAAKKAATATTAGVSGVHEGISAVADTAQAISHATSVGADNVKKLGSAASSKTSWLVGGMKELGGVIWFLARDLPVVREVAPQMMSGFQEAACHVKPEAPETAEADDRPRPEKLVTFGCLTLKNVLVVVIHKPASEGGVADGSAAAPVAVQLFPTIAVQEEKFSHERKLDSLVMFHWLNRLVLRAAARSGFNMAGKTTGQIAQLAVNTTFQLGHGVSGGALTIAKGVRASRALSAAAAFAAEPEQDVRHSTVCSEARTGAQPGDAAGSSAEVGTVNAATSDRAIDGASMADRLASENVVAEADDTSAAAGGASTATGMGTSTTSGFAASASSAVSGGAKASLHAVAGSAKMLVGAAGVAGHTIGSSVGSAKSSMSSVADGAVVLGVVASSNASQAVGNAKAGFSSVSGNAKTIAKIAAASFFKPSSPNKK
eukprot:gnl/TRDRNA2_/TRDRNA2_165748_c0_seq2.p1 gnl/TRDRNA2_/TRDRNA2_165748_c0~~gnl/TRDRNA2_/TRDRNA2_165748_c0_seq2.p1  ORF type:complete len:695 (-),score=128.62 gnl/TRDRNA2_/TRDRNA2_165748_c0_seq2:68-2152(-)